MKFKNNIFLFASLIIIILLSFFIYKNYTIKNRDYIDLTIEFNSYDLLPTKLIFLNNNLSNIVDLNSKNLSIYETFKENLYLSLESHLSKEKIKIFYINKDHFNFTIKLKNIIKSKEDYYLDSIIDFTNKKNEEILENIYSDLAININNDVNRIDNYFNNNFDYLDDDYLDEIKALNDQINLYEKNEDLIPIKAHLKYILENKKYFISNKIVGYNPYIAIAMINKFKLIEENINKLNISNLIYTSEFARYYPFKKLVSVIIGILSIITILILNILFIYRLRLKN